ncbi:DNA glycosylase AlkZ-like family protein [Nocardioides sp.]|uniref:DNA glycosylase AlkZ-like family protein n=1 Tax=Nocardioides sp. TaxID=35761 RepID=UPI0027234D77|nr:crosslink repair DNA glycosylase YcaQ family protein [Nocardioides sp.]MDO9456896.1 crosslink repair DNA glycosylase YcaQ family protein [Nocardioides sp.]
MATVHQLSRQDARRVAVRAQLLTADRPDDVLEVVRHLTFVQLDPTRYVAPSADLVLWSRLGSSYDVGELRDLLDTQALIDHHQLARPAEDLALYRAEMTRWPGPEPLRPWQEDVRGWVEANDGCRRDVLELLRGDGPLPASEIPDTCEVAWPSSGWNNDKNIKMLLAHMVERGEVARAGRGGRSGREVLWDLAERIYPDDPVPSPEDAATERDRRRLRSLGIARATSAKMPSEPHDVGSAGEPAVVEGVKGTWRVDPVWLDTAFAGRAALLSPLDRLVADRKRLTEVFEAEYYLEMYKPASQRRWGYWALPVLWGDRLVGKLDVVADREAGELRVDATHQDEPWSAACVDGVRREVDDLAGWLGLAPVVLG